LASEDGRFAACPPTPRFPTTVIDVKTFVKNIGFKLGLDIRRIAPNDRNNRCVSLRPESGVKGYVLLSYILDPFLLKTGERISNAHTHHWESFQIAKTFLDFGYAVDVIDYRNEEFRPSKEYGFLIAARTNFERLASLLNRDCTKIAHLDTSHWMFNNWAAYKRGIALQDRKGITAPVGSLRLVEPNYAIEHADCATLLGNRFTMDTYQYANKPLFAVPVSTCSEFPWPQSKDFAACRKSFLWFGSGGFVHKGLDLVLDAFAEMPDFHLYICGPVKEEKLFSEIYRDELYCLPNIHCLGWVDVGGKEFIDVMNHCVGIIYPSCAEGQCGSVVQCLHGGLVPVVSYESGLDIAEFGVILKECSIREIRESLQGIGNRSAGELRDLAMGTREFARTNHTRERFANEFKNAISCILQNKAGINRMENAKGVLRSGIAANGKAGEF
jgi:glycosyltransferase involved in cell wall biosynthesis